MRTKRDTQDWLNFQPSNLQLTNEYFGRYEAISGILDATPALLDLVHRDLEAALEQENRERKRRGGFVYTSEMVLRLALCQDIEGLSLRDVVVRVDDSNYLRRFTRIHEGPMMNFTTLCGLRNSVRPETWKAMNTELARAAVEQEQISGDRLRLDTTAVETNIHWPADSSLLWDSYRTLARLIEQARELDPNAVDQRRIHLRRVKKTATKIARMSQAKGRKAADLKGQYERLICQVTGICDWAAELVPRLRQGLRASRYQSFDAAIALDVVEQIVHFERLARHVVRQATERVLNETTVPNDDKIFSIFEEHSELLKRGKAGKPIEFGHMIQIQQTDEKFITGFEVFAKKPVEPTLVLPAIESHEALFGHPPQVVTADKGYWSEEELEAVFEKVDVVSIPKKGRRNSAEEEREHDPLFKIAQRFRAGVEGSISFLKRALRLARCMNKGWEHFVSTVGATVLAHNLLVLARC